MQSYYIVVLEIVILTWICCFHPVSCQTNVSTSDMEALQIFHTSTGGKKWNYTSLNIALLKYDYLNLDGIEWNFTTNHQGDFIGNPCGQWSDGSDNWAGIRCSYIGSKCVINYLILNNGALTGKIPKEIGNLTALHQLNLENNYLEGVLPGTLGNLQQLSILNLAQNSFHGSLDVVNSLNHSLIMTLMLSQNKFTGVIPDFSAFEVISLICLDNNMLTGLPVNMFSPVNLEMEFLWLQNNMISGVFPESISKLTGLTYLYLQNNKFVGHLPASLGNCTALTNLDLSRNQFSGPLQVSTFSKMTTLRSMIVSYNYFTTGTNGNLFGWITILPTISHIDLKVLDLSNNKFTGLIEPNIFKLTKLESISLQSNCFHGPLPTSICEATSLVVLIMADLSGGETCSQQYWKNTALRHLFDGFFIENYLSGEVPTCIFDGLPALQAVSLSGNRLSGYLPDTEWSQSLLKIDLAQNRIRGGLPSYLSTGVIPFIDFSYNYIDGTLEDFENWKPENNNNTLYLSENRISGKIPQAIHDIDTINILGGNLFDCVSWTSNYGSMPANDPANLTYDCGSQNMDKTLAIIVSIILFFIFCGYFWKKYHKSYEKYACEISLWLSVSQLEDDDTMLSRELSNYPHLQQFARLLRRFRDLSWKLGFSIAIFFSIVYWSMQGPEFHSLTHAYSWEGTVAYLSGPTPAAVVFTFFVLFLLAFRYVVYLDTKEAITSKKTIIMRASKPRPSVGIPNSWVNSVILPLLRIIIIFIINLATVVLANLAYLYLIEYGSEMEKFFATVCLSIYKLTWSTVIFPELFHSEFFMFRISRAEHLKFQKSIFGDEMVVMFVYSALSTLIIPVFTAIISSNSCLHDIFIAPSGHSLYYEQKGVCTSFTLGECAPGNVFTTVPGVKLPFIYNYSCASQMVKLYIPVFLLGNLFIILECVFHLVYMVWFTQHQRELEESTTLISFILRFPAEMIGKNKRLMWSFNRRKQTCDNEAPDEEYFRYTYSLSFYLNLILILCTFGVFAPVLGFVMAISIYLHILVDEMLLGRFLVINAGMSSLYKLGVGTPVEYTVSHTQGTFVRIQPDNLSRRLKTLRCGQKIMMYPNNVITQNMVSKRGSVGGNLNFAKICGDSGWVALESLSIDSNSDSDSSVVYSVVPDDDNSFFRRLLDNKSLLAKTGIMQEKVLKEKDEEDSSVENSYSASVQQLLSEVIPSAVWLSQHDENEIENQIISGEDPWGCVNILKRLEKESMPIPPYFLRYSQRVTTYVFCILAGCLLNDIYNGDVLAAQEENNLTYVFAILSVGVFLDIVYILFKKLSCVTEIENVYHEDDKIDQNTTEYEINDINEIEKGVEMNPIRSSEHLSNDGVELNHFRPSRSI